MSAIILWDILSFNFLSMTKLLPSMWFPGLHHRFHVRRLGPHFTKSYTFSLLSQQGSIPHHILSHKPHTRETIRLINSHSTGYGLMTWTVDLHGSRVFLATAEGGAGGTCIFLLLVTHMTCLWTGWCLGRWSFQHQRGWIVLQYRSVQLVFMQHTHVSSVSPGKQIWGGG